MGEIIFTSFGQSGVQAGNAIWELFCLEHGISPDGTTTFLDPADLQESQCIYHPCAGGQRRVPRAVIADLEPTVVDEIRTGPYRSLFHPRSLINTYEDAANNYARGSITQGKQLIQTVMEELRRTVERCSHLSGIFLSSSSGGTGSGFTDLFISKVNSQYPKSDKVAVQLVPASRLTSAIIEPYNTILSMKSLMDSVEVVLSFDNESLYNVCQRMNNRNPSYSHLNRIMAQMYSNLTSCYRFSNCLKSDFITMQTNVVPYPRIHFLCPSHSPIVDISAVDHTPASVYEITRAAFSKETTLCNAPLEQGRFLSCSLQYRGNVQISEINTSLQQLKNDPQLKFVNWNPTGFKIGLTHQFNVVAPGTLMGLKDKTLTMLSNTSSIADMWSVCLGRFHSLFQKRAYVHWFVGEGMEESELLEASSQMSTLMNDYRELGMSLPEEDEGETNTKNTNCYFNEEAYLLGDPSRNINNSCAQHRTAWRNSNLDPCHLPHPSPTSNTVSHSSDELVRTKELERYHNMQSYCEVILPE